MAKTKKTLLFVTILLIVGLGWYLFIKKYDYQITFRVKTAPGTVYQGIRTWARQAGSEGNMEIKELKNIPFDFISHEINKNDTIIRFDWSVQPLNDSITKVKMGITNTKEKLITRLKIPFVKSWLEKYAISQAIDLKEGMTVHLQNFKVKILGENKIPEKFCAYVTVECKQPEKAMKMIEENFVMTQFLSDNNLEMEGYPFLEITSWDIETEDIVFDFCFPIGQKAHLPEHDEIKYKKIPAKPALKAVYNGNYRTSDRAWYALYDYARRHDLRITNAPVEFFHNNPMAGGNDLTWKTEVFMPLKQD